MTEVLCCHVIVLAIYFLYRYFISFSFVYLVFSAILFSAVWYLKVQFIYILSLPIVLFIWFSFPNKQRQFRQIGIDFLALVAILLFFVLVYYFLWYKPHQSFYDYLFVAENKSRINKPDHVWETMRFYYQHVLLIPEMKWHTLFFWLTLSGASLLTLGGKMRFETKFFLTASFFWFGLELHKLMLLYIPLRYIIPLMYAALFFGAVTISAWAIRLFEKVKNTKLLPFAVLILLVVFSPVLIERFTHLQALIMSKTYHIQSANNYLSAHIKTTQPVVGNWSSTFTWSIKNENMPVSRWIINDDKIFTSVFPEVIIAEEDEMDSDGAYIKRNIYLSELSDSTRQFTIGK